MVLTGNQKHCNEIKEPVWIVNIPREFYDFEDFKTGKWDNYDLFMPQYGEVLSGARREYEYSKIFEKMEREKVRKENYSIILKMAKDGRLKTNRRRRHRHGTHRRIHNWRPTHRRMPTLPTCPRKRTGTLNLR